MKPYLLLLFHVIILYHCFTVVQSVGDGLYWKKKANLSPPKKPQTVQYQPKTEEFLILFGKGKHSLIGTVIRTARDLCGTSVTSTSAIIKGFSNYLGTTFNDMDKQQLQRFSASDIQGFIQDIIYVWHANKSKPVSHGDQIADPLRLFIYGGKISQKGQEKDKKIDFAEQLKPLVSIVDIAIEQFIRPLEKDIDVRLAEAPELIVPKIVEKEEFSSTTSKYAPKKTLSEAPPKKSTKTKIKNVLIPTLKWQKRPNTPPKLNLSSSPTTTTTVIASTIDKSSDKEEEDKKLGSDGGASSIVSTKVLETSAAPTPPLASPKSPISIATDILSPSDITSLPQSPSSSSLDSHANESESKKTSHDIVVSLDHTEPTTDITIMKSGPGVSTILTDPHEATTPITIKESSRETLHEKEKEKEKDEKDNKTLTETVVDDPSLTMSTEVPETSAALTSPLASPKSPTMVPTSPSDTTSPLSSPSSSLKSDSEPAKSYIGYKVWHKAPEVLHAQIIQNNTPPSQAPSSISSSSDSSISSSISSDISSSSSIVRSGSRTPPAARNYHLGKFKELGIDAVPLTDEQEVVDPHASFSSGSSPLPVTSSSIYSSHVPYETMLLPHSTVSTDVGSRGDLITPPLEGSLRDSGDVYGKPDPSRRRMSTGTDVEDLAEVDMKRRWSVSSSIPTSPTMALGPSPPDRFQFLDEFGYFSSTPSIPLSIHRGMRFTGRTEQRDEKEKKTRLYSPSPLSTSWTLPLPTSPHRRESFPPLREPFPIIPTTRGDVEDQSLFTRKSSLEDEMQRAAGSLSPPPIIKPRLSVPQLLPPSELVPPDLEKTSEEEESEEEQLPRGERVISYQITIHPSPSHPKEKVKEKEEEEESIDREDVSGGKTMETLPKAETKTSLYQDLISKFFRIALIGTVIVLVTTYVEYGLLKEQGQLVSESS